MIKPIPQPQPNAHPESDHSASSFAAFLSSQSGTTQARNRWLSILRKVPEVTIYFWIIKLLTTAMGEVTSDYLAHQLNPVIAVALGAIGLTTALVLQFWVRRYVAAIYWLAVVMVAIFGTM